MLVETLRALDERIRLLDTEIARRAKEDEVARRLMTVPGIGPIIATALTALAPSAETFQRGRDFAAWLGLTPLQRSTGGKQRQDLENGGTNAAPPAHHRGERGCAVGGTEGSCDGIIGWHACSGASHRCW